MGFIKDEDPTAMELQGSIEPLYLLGEGYYLHVRDVGEVFECVRERVETIVDHGYKKGFLEKKDLLGDVEGTISVLGEQGSIDRSTHLTRIDETLDAVLIRSEVEGAAVVIIYRFVTTSRGEEVEIHSVCLGMLREGDVARFDPLFSWSRGIHEVTFERYREGQEQRVHSMSGWRM